MAGGTAILADGGLSLGHEKATTARKLRQCVRAVLDGPWRWELRPDNPCDRIGPALGPQKYVVRHMKALPHGFRSSSREATEAALAHVVRNQVKLPTGARTCSSVGVGSWTTGPSTYPATEVRVLERVLAFKSEYGKDPRTG